MTDSKETTGMLKPGTSIKPILDEARVPHLVKTLFGLDVISSTKLNAYDDLNFWVKVGKTSTNENIPSPCDSGYVFKVMNSMDSQMLDLLSGQNEFMLHLHSKNYQCSLPLKSVKNEYLPIIQLPTDPNENAVRSHAARLLTFIPGKTLHSVALTPELCSEAGHFLAKMHGDLKDFHNEAIASRRFIWMMSETLETRKFLDAITDPEKLALVEGALNAWEARVLPHMQDLPKGPVHGDFNEQNILVRATSDTQHQPEPSFSVLGCIDFGDVSVSCYVFDLAILVMSLLTMTNDPSVAAQAISGYCIGRQLTDLEWSVLYECVCARLCTSLTMGAYSIKQDPGNVYLLTTAKQGWAVLASLVNASKASTLASWRRQAPCQ